MTARERAEAAQGSLDVCEDSVEAYQDAVVICAKSWGRLDAYGLPMSEARPEPNLRDAWRVDESKMARTDGAHFMHCLPIRRNVIATDGVLDSPRSAVVRQASNRLWSAVVLFAELLG